MRPTWAVASLMIKESIRMKVALIFIVLLAVLLPFLGLTVRGDGVTLASRIQMFLSFSLTAVSFLLSMLTIFLGCGSLSNEIRDKQIVLVASKPIPRWQFVTGKWLGISVLNLALLAGSGAIVYGFTWYLKRQPAVNLDDRYRVTHEVLTARAGQPLKAPDMTGRVEETIRQLRSEGRLSDTTAENMERTRRDIKTRLVNEYFTIPPGEVRVYLFKDLLVERSPEKYLHVRYRSQGGTMPRDEVWHTLWLAGDPREGTTVVRRERRDAAQQTQTVPIPSQCVSKDGILRLEIANLDARTPLSFTGYDGMFELLYGLGSFEWNLARALVLVYFQLLFLAVLAVMLSSFLSFPVACMACLLVYFTATGGGWLKESMEWMEPAPASADPLWLFGPIIRSMTKGFIWSVPNLAEYNPIPTLVDGRVVTLKWLIFGLAYLVIARGLLLGLAACAIFTRRELAQVII
jgi:hypothetical protein